MMSSVGTWKILDIPNGVLHSLSDSLSSQTQKISAFAALLFHSFEYMRPIIYQGLDIIIVYNTVQDFREAFTSAKQIAVWGFIPIALDISIHALKSLIGITALALQVLGNPTGQILLTAQKFFSSIFDLFWHLRDKQYSPAAETALIVLTQLLYLTISFYGGDWLKISAYLMDIMSQIGPFLKSFQGAQACLHKMNKKSATLTRQMEEFTQIANSFNKIMAENQVDISQIQQIDRDMRALFQELGLKEPPPMQESALFMDYIQPILNSMSIAWEDLKQKKAELDASIKQDAGNLGSHYGTLVCQMLSLIDLILLIADLRPKAIA